MSFWPFPKTLLDECRAGLRRGPGIELGSGSGELRRRLAASGVSLIATDLQLPADVRMDASRMAIVPDSIGLIVAGNLMRHLTPPARRDVLGECARVLRDDGRMIVLEDDPRGRSPAEANYREALTLLARADRSRGPAVAIDLALCDRPAGLQEIVWSGSVENEERPGDPLAPADWLLAQGTAPERELEDHRARVLEHGMEYGLYQAVILRRTPSAGSRGR